ncbi:alkaline phosphatase [Babesia caballi]|uniref:Alkaline phosphatase n=1 Tax=Babesia caballi TaxID=5871 RepID=A0AAV4LU50_BABCB|nr:alkaline phosphatase [Babesia caballi]
MTRGPVGDKMTRLLCVLVDQLDRFRVHDVAHVAVFELAARQVELEGVHVADFLASVLDVSRARGEKDPEVVAEPAAVAADNDGVLILPEHALVEPQHLLVYRQMGNTGALGVLQSARVHFRDVWHHHYLEKWDGGALQIGGEGDAVGVGNNLLQQMFAATQHPTSSSLQTWIVSPVRFRRS